jgi:RES domain-containing protein
LNLTGAFQQFKLSPFDGIVHRIFDPGHGFLETIGSYLSGGRWNRQSVYGALYTSLSKETAIAENRHIAERKKIKPSELGRRDHVVIQVQLTRVVDLTHSGFYVSLNVPQETILNDTHSSRQLCLEIADQARRIGSEAFLVPSATRLGVNLVIYMDCLHPGWLLHEIDREEDITLTP